MAGSSGVPRWVLTHVEWNKRIASDLSSADANDDGKITLGELPRARENLSIGDALKIIFWGSMRRRRNMKGFCSRATVGCNIVGTFAGSVEERGRRPVAWGHWTLTGFHAPKFEDALQNRVGAMAAGHNLISKADWQHAELEKLATTILQPFTESDSLRLKLADPAAFRRSRAGYDDSARAGDECRKIRCLVRLRRHAEPGLRPGDDDRAADAGGYWPAAVPLGEGLPPIWVSKSAPVPATSPVA